jgi:hypothetical protein
VVVIGFPQADVSRDAFPTGDFSSSGVPVAFSADVRTTVALIAAVTYVTAAEVTLLGSRRSPGTFQGVMVETQLTLTLPDAEAFARTLQCCTAEEFEAAGVSLDPRVGPAELWQLEQRNVATGRTFLRVVQYPSPPPGAQPPVSHIFALLFLISLSHANLARSVAGAMPTPTDDYLFCCSHEISVLILVVIGLVAVGAAALGLWARGILLLPALPELRPGLRLESGLQRLLLRALGVRPLSPQHSVSPAAREYASPSKVAPLPLPSPQHPQPDSGRKVRTLGERGRGKAARE